MEGQKRPIRLKSLSADYTEDAIRERISGARIVKPKEKAAAVVQPKPQKIGLLIDLQNSIKAQNSPGYERWAKVFNIKLMSQALLFLQDNGIGDIENLRDKAQGAKDKVNRISARIQVIDSRLSTINTLEKHIGSYIKTKDVYAGYRKAGYRKKYLAEHEAALAAHKAAKAYFDEQKLEKLPTIKMLQQEYAVLTAEKNKLYSELKPARKFMQDILSTRQNVEQFYNYRDAVPMKKNERI